MLQVPVGYKSGCWQGYVPFCSLLGQMYFLVLSSFSMLLVFLILFSKLAKEGQFFLTLCHSDTKSSVFHVHI